MNIGEIEIDEEKLNAVAMDAAFKIAKGEIDKQFGTDQSPAIAMIIARRKKHAAHEGWNPPTDRGELAIAAACYALAEYCRCYGRLYVNELLVKWPFQKEDWKPSPEDRLRELAIAGAFIADEMDRLIKMGSDKK